MQNHNNRKNANHMCNNRKKHRNITIGKALFMLGITVGKHRSYTTYNMIRDSGACTRCQVPVQQAHQSILFRTILAHSQILS